MDAVVFRGFMDSIVSIVSMVSMDSIDPLLPATCYLLPASKARHAPCVQRSPLLAKFRRRGAQIFAMIPLPPLHPKRPIWALKSQIWGILAHAYTLALTKPPKLSTFSGEGTTFSGKPDNPDRDKSKQNTY